MEVTIATFTERIVKDFGLDDKTKIIQRNFPTVKGRRKINASQGSIIVDKEGNEHPYMLTVNKRNDGKLVDFDYIYTVVYKGLLDVIKESGLKLKTEPCRICEGGGWYRNGTKIFYKDISCEY